MLKFQPRKSSMWNNPFQFFTYNFAEYRFINRFLLFVEVFAEILGTPYLIFFLVS